jgi:hypothetical protein
MPTATTCSGSIAIAGRAGSVGGVSDETIVRHAPTITEAGAVVYVFFLEGALRGAAEFRPEGPLAKTAEAAFSVERHW